MSDVGSLLAMRRAVPEDAERLAEIQARAVLHCGQPFYAEPVLEAWAWGNEKREACRGWIREPGVHVILCERSGFALAFAVYVARIDSVYVHSLYCDPDAIGRGIGRALIGEIEAFAKAGAKRHLTVQSSLNAVVFYRALGFLRLRDGFQELGPDRLRWDYVAMGKPLAP